MPRDMWMVMAGLMRFQRGTKTIWNGNRPFVLYSGKKNLAVFCRYPEDLSETSFQK